ncbi:MAG: tRNA (adenosine(37)-N6)-dimethylallyltransferase MiaA, partial [Nitrospiria bacterium]
LHLGTEIISSDSRQVYRGMDIGTAKPDSKDRARVAHHLIDVVDPDEPFSAGRFRTMAQPVIARLHRQARIPIVVGGTGLYVKLLIQGLWQGPQSALGGDWDLRERLRKEEAIYGPGYLHQKLQAVDSESANRINPRDLVKIIRAIEVYERTASPLSAFHHGHRFGERPYRAIMIGLRRSRPDLYRRIERRVDEMMGRGFEEEVKGLLKKGYSPDLSSMKGLGYRQMIGYLKGEYDRNEAIRRLKRDTRRYAKRQFTWFNRDPDIQWIDLGPSDRVEEISFRVRTVIQQREEIAHAKG